MDNRKIVGKALVKGYVIRGMETNLIIWTILNMGYSYRYQDMLTDIRKARKCYATS